MYFMLMIDSFVWPHCIGQTRIKEVLEAAIVNDSLGHAYLFSGDEGCGKFAAALDVALGLLCENPKVRPCLACPSCRKVRDYAHPDFHIIMPVVLAKEHKSDGDLSASGWEEVARCAKERISEPYSMADHEKAPSIPVDWIREVNHTIQGGAHGAGMNVAILDGVDVLNREAANSMLKLLEEPPPGTVLLLLTSRMSEVLPTIVSRCQILRFAWLSPKEIRDELARRFGAEETAEADSSIFDTGSLGKSLQLFKNPPAEARKDAAAFLELCNGGEWPAIAQRIDEMVEWKDLDRYENFFGAVIGLVRDAFLHELPGIENVFLTDRPWRPPAAFSHDGVGMVLDICAKSIAAVRGYANTMLVLSNCAIALVEVFRAQKQ
jgi:DNA polymerase III delta' subunit